MKKFMMTSALTALFPALAAAQEFEGAYISIERLSYSSEGEGRGTDFYGSSAASIGAELGLGPAFGVSADITNYGGDINNLSGTLHAFYRFGQETAIGAFYGFDEDRYIYTM